MSITEQQQPVEHVEDLTGGLVDGHHHRLPGLLSKVLQRADEGVGGGRVKARRWLLVVV